MLFDNINWAIFKFPLKRRRPMVSNNYEITVFHFNDSKTNFDDMGYDNDARHWYARDLMQLLEYESYASFRSVINKAISACASLNINITENFIETQRNIDGKDRQDFKLSRFACYLVAMNGDSKKPQVAKAQVYFVAIAETFRNYIEGAENVERVLVRDEVSGREKSLSGVASEHGVEQYQFFQNAGYRGLYNKNLSDLKAYKGFDQLKRSLLDFMGKEELAANLFRLTQTEAKIKKDSIYGQAPLEETAETVGRKVRKAMMEISGNAPEDLPLSEDIKRVKTKLRVTERKLKKIDKK